MTVTLSEKAQLRRLLREFSFRFLDNELLSAEGDSSQTMVHALALVGAAGLTLSLLFVYKYIFRLPDTLSAAQLDLASLPDKGFVIALAMAVTGLAAVVTWDGLFPDRRECLALSALPLRNRTIFAAKTFSLLLLFLAVAVALNLPTTLLLPWLVLSQRIAPVAYFSYVAAHFVAVTGACVFVFCGLLGVQAVLLNMLAFRHYKRVSAWVQFAALFSVLTAFFLAPEINRPEDLSALIAGYFPQYWFLGLYEELLGNRTPAVLELAARARAAFLLSAGLATLAYCLGFGRYMRRTIEEADTVQPGPRGHSAGLLRGFLNRTLLETPVECAVFHFVARTITRNRKPRLMLAVYIGIGTAYVFHNLAALVYGRGADGGVMVASVPLILSFFILLGMRVLFTIPVELGANWVFRLTENGCAADYLSGVRKFMLACGILPLLLGSLPLYGLAWGWASAFRHFTLMLLILLLVVEYLLRGLTKIPFTCSFLPGKANLKTRFGFYCVYFLFFGYVISALELMLARNGKSFWLGVVVLCAFLAWRIRLRRQWEGTVDTFTYEERPEWMVAASLNLTS